MVLAQGPAAVSQDPQHRQLLVIDDRAQAGHAGRGERDRMRVGGVGFAALTGGEHPGPGRQLGRDVHHMLTVGDQPPGDVPADARHPSTAQVRSGHRRTARRIARYPDASVPYRPPPSTASSAVMTSIVADRLCGSIPITTALITTLHPISPVHLRGEGGHRYFELRKPLLSLSLPMTAPGPRRPNESHTTSVSSRNESDEPGA